MSTVRGQRMIGRLLMQFGNSPLLQGLLDAFGAELDELEQAFADLREKRWIDTGEGQQLDGCGEIVIQPRRINKAIAIAFFGFQGQTGATGFGQGRIRKNREAYLSTAVLADPEYRQILWAKVAKNTTDGSTESIIASLRRLYGARIILEEMGNATIWVAVGRELTNAEILLANALNLLIKPGGFKIASKSWFVDGATFGFANQNQGYLGFGQGRFAKQF